MRPKYAAHNALQLVGRDWPVVDPVVVARQRHTLALEWSIRYAVPIVGYAVVSRPYSQTFAGHTKQAR